MTINEYMRANRAGQMNQVKRLTCVDGFHMSVQASQYTYCSPRIDNAKFYTQVEVGFPSAKPECFAEYAEDDSDYTDTVYGYVPVELVDEEISRHGGIAV